MRVSEATYYWAISPAFSMPRRFTLKGQALGWIGRHGGEIVDENQIDPDLRASY